MNLNLNKDLKDATLEYGDVIITDDNETIMLVRNKNIGFQCDLLDLEEMKIINSYRDMDTVQKIVNEGRNLNTGDCKHSKIVRVIKKDRLELRLV